MLSLQRSVVVPSRPFGSSILHLRPLTPGCRPTVAAAAKRSRTTGSPALDGAIEVAGGLVSAAASLVPESVPRPVAKGGVAVIGTTLVFWALQQLVSGVLTIALLAGAAWFYFKASGPAEAGGGNRSGSSAQDEGDPNDPLSEARRIMDKYK